MIRPRIILVQLKICGSLIISVKANSRLHSGVPENEECKLQFAVSSRKISKSQICLLTTNVFAGLKLMEAPIIQGFYFLDDPNVVQKICTNFFT